MNNEQQNKPVAVPITYTHYLVEGISIIKQNPGKMMMLHSSSTRQFKDCPYHIPMAMLSENRAKTNHCQTLQTLDDRMGMGILEILDNIHDRKLSIRKETETDLLELNELIEKFYTSLRSYPAINFPESFAGRKDLTENEDFKFDYQLQSAMYNYTGTWLSNRTKEEYHMSNKDHRRIVAIPISIHRKPDCSEHKKEVLGCTDMKVLAEIIGDLHYETLAELLRQIAIKINGDGVIDTNGGRKELGRHLYFASTHLENAFEAIQECWLISKPFMENKTESK